MRIRIMLAGLLTAAMLSSPMGSGVATKAAAVPAVRDRLLGATDPSSLIRLSLVLRTPGQSEMDSLARELYDPASPGYHRFVQPGEIGARFGLPSETIQRVERQVVAAGLRVTGTYPQRTALEIQGSALRVERYFRVSLSDYLDPYGRRYHAPAAPPIVPPAIADAVQSITGLLNRPPPPPVLPVADVPAAGLKPADVAKAYDTQPLLDLGVDGSGQTVGIFSQGATLSDADVTGFETQTSIPAGPALTHVDVAGGLSQDDRDKPNEEALGETALDVDIVRGTAPQANIRLYEAPGRMSLAGALRASVDQLMADRAAGTPIDIMSISYGFCDAPTIKQYPDFTDFLLPEERAAAERSFEMAYTAGVTILIASGDAGAYSCRRYDKENRPIDHRLLPLWPGDSQFVLSVGGTLLSVQQDGSYLEEAGWEDALTYWGTGGGLNPYDNRPDWQRGPGVDNAFSNGHRQAPDVAASGDPDSGFFIVLKGEGTGGRGGTSASTPFWAGSLALIRQFAGKQGVQSLGMVAPMLYDIARTQQQFPPFHDVTRGGNFYYPCTPGWDYATGLGSPDVYNLARDVVAYLTR